MKKVTSGKELGMPNRRGVNHFQQQGFTLIEVLIAVLVLSFGLLAIGNFQATLLKESAYSKARGEAIALAQEKLEELRNFSTDHDLVGNLKNAPVATPAVNSEYKYPSDVPAALNTYTDTKDGSNATFTRKWSISRNGAVTIARVTVTWTGEDNKDQTVTLDTKLANSNPRGTADVGQISNPKVRSPTGKAYLGDGHLNQDAMTTVEADTRTTDNNDGTLTADYDSDGDLELIVKQSDGSGEVVLTLPDACQIATGCDDFVKVNGTVFLDRTSNLSVNGNQIFVLASDAAYCARWVPVSADVATNTLVTKSDLSTYTNNTWPAKSDGDIYRDNDASADNTGNGDGTSDYDYFNYTCYLGGAWYGNIGVVITGINQQAQGKIFGCVGDPEVPLDANGDALNVTDAWKVVQVVKRRVYRGMIQKYTLDGNGDHVLEVDGNGVDVARAHGIRDAIVLPDPNWLGHEAGHDFVIVNGVSQTQADCLTALTRPDANPPAVAPATTPPPNLFSNVVGDFVCLNADGNDTDTAAPWDKFLYAPWEYLHTFDTAVYDAPGDCPYNPSNPPSHVFQIIGTLSLDGPTTTKWGSADPTDLTDDILGNINTSKAVGDCSITGQTASSITYSCNYYVWEDTSKPNVTTLEPWNGNIQVDTPYGVVCHAGTTFDKTKLASHSTYELTGLKGTPNPTTGVDFTCKTLNKNTIQGQVSVDPGNDLSTETILVEADNAVTACQYSIINTQTASYSCEVQEQTYTGGYTGDVRITLPATYSCNASSTDGSVTVVDNLATFSFANLPVDTASSTGNDIVCDGPMEQYTISGTAVNGSNPITTTLEVTPTVTDSSGAIAGSCTTQRNAADIEDQDYSCDVVVDTRISTSWQGQVTLAPVAGFWCDVAGADKIIDVTTTASVPLPDVTCEPDSADVIIEGAVFVPLSYVSTTTLDTYTYEGPGLGAYDMSCNFVGAGNGAYNCVLNTTVDGVRLYDDYPSEPLYFGIKMTPTIATLPSGNCDILSNTTVWEPPAAAEQGQWHKFSCRTAKAMNRNKIWTGHLRVETTSSNTASAWDLCGVGGHTAVTVINTSTIDNTGKVIGSGDVATADYTSTGIAPGTTVDNVFLGLTYSTVATCAPYEPNASPASFGPWTWSDGTNTFSVSLPWTPTYVP